MYKHLYYRFERWRGSSTDVDRLWSICGNDSWAFLGGSDLFVIEIDLLSILPLYCYQQIQFNDEQIGSTQKRPFPISGHSRKMGLWRTSTKTLWMVTLQIWKPGSRWRFTGIYFVCRMENEWVRGDRVRGTGWFPQIDHSRSTTVILPLPPSKRDCSRLYNYWKPIVAGICRDWPDWE